MKLLNVGCGGNRPQDEHWWNLDCLREILKPGTPERENLDREPRYVEWDLNKGGMPFGNDVFDGILCSHVVEHFPAHAAASLLRNCRYILKPGGLLVVSVPDAEYFLKVYDRDTPENAVELFGEPISKDEPWQKSFFDYALFHREHQQILTEASLRCLLLKVAFKHVKTPKWILEGAGTAVGIIQPTPVFHEILKIMNRRRFSAELVAIKSA